MASGTMSGRQVSAHAIVGVDPSVALAVDLPGGGCADDSELISAWSFAFGTAAGTSGARDALCRAGTPTPPDCG